MKYIHYALIDCQVRWVCMAHWGLTLSIGGIYHAIQTDESDIKESHADYFKDRYIEYRGLKYDGPINGVLKEIAEVMMS